MALDGVTLAHLIKELNPLLRGARIDKIQQPEKEEIHLVLRQLGQTLRLLLNAGATSPRLHLTDITKKNPVSPPMFCMILRKHLEGGKILEVIQERLERTVTLIIQNYNEYGDLAQWHLHLEIMGKHSNLLLVDPVTNTILDGLKRYSHAVSRHREVLPGRPYLAPPSQGKISVDNEEDWRQALFAGEWDRPLPGLLVERFDGISPELAREIIVRAGLEFDIRLTQCGDIDLNRLFQSYTLLADPASLSALEPCLYFEMASSGTASLNFNPSGQPPAAFSFLPFQQYYGLFCQKARTLNEAVARFYELKSGSNQLEARRGTLRRLVRDAQAHLDKKLANYEETLNNAGQSLIYRKWGELLTANLYRIQLGATSVELEDYTEETLPYISIPLDPLLNGNDNAQRYYRLYNKAKATIQKTTPLQASAQVELLYLGSLLLALEQASSQAELEEISEELAEQGYISGKSAAKTNKAGQSRQTKKGFKGHKAAKSPRPEPSKPRIFTSSQGRLILVGKNNRQNDRLAMKQGNPQDLWLHVKNIPGSHVLIPLNENEEFPDDQTLEEAAALAIFFSQARGSSQVPVDYTHVKQLKKPNAAKPGMVVYEQNWTLYLTPKDEVLQRLLTGESTPNE